MSSVVLSNLATEVGQSQSDTNITSVNHFNRFLAYVHQQNPDELPLLVVSGLSLANIHFISAELMGKFADYLISVVKVPAMNTTLNYLSSVKNVLEAKFPLLETTQFAGKWYTKCRTRITFKYAQASKESGTRLVNSAPTMLEQDLIRMSELLFQQNNREADMNRCLFTWQWQTIGRISEVSALQLQQLSNHSSRLTRNAIEFIMYRNKTAVESQLRVFVHADRWQVCPFHSMASSIITNSTVSTLFTQVVATHEAQYVNRVFARLLATLSTNSGADIQKLTDKLLSHSTRSGSASFANEHPDINTSWIVLRGGWTVDGLQTVFNYLCGTVKTDSCVGRALSGWPSADNGGNCPSIECIPEADKMLFRHYCGQLLGAASEELRFPLMCSILLHFHEVYEKYPDHNLFDRLMGVEEVDVDRIHVWIAHVKRAFRKYNAPFLPVSSLEGDDVISYTTFSEYCDKSVAMMNILREEVECVNAEVVTLQHLYHNTEDRLARMESMLMKLTEGRIADVPMSPPPTRMEIPAVTPFRQTLSFGSPPPLPSSSVESLEQVPVRSREDRPWPSDLESLTLVTVGQLFLRWYTDELYWCDPTTLAKPARQKFAMCAKTVEFCKMFLPGGAVLKGKPVDIQRQSPWRQQLASWAAGLDESVLHAVERYIHAKNGHLSVQTPPVKKRKRSHTNRVATTYKSLTAMETAKVLVEYLPLQHPACIDHASCLTRD